MLQTKHLTILFTDMKGFTTKTATQSRQQLQHLLELQDELIRPVFKQFGGTLVKTIGDAFLVTFESPTDAVLCGMKIQENILNHNARAASIDQIEIRIAINSGEVNIKDGDVFGEPVNIASRIESIAEPNEVYFTEAVYLIMNKNEIPTAEVGYRKLKGIPEEIKVYKVMSEQTNLIRAKLRRQNQAAATANLSKDEEHLAESDPEIKKALKRLENSGEEELKSQGLIPEPQKEETKKSFWQKYKNKIMIIVAILIFLIIIGKTNENRKQKLDDRLDLHPSQISDFRDKITNTKQDFDKAVANNDQEKIDEILDNLQEISKQKLPTLLNKTLTSFVKNQLKNPRLSSENKEVLAEILKNLKP